MELTASLRALMTVLTVASVVATAAIHLRVRSRVRRKLAKRRGLNAVIIGASSGVGEHLAYEYATRGARLVLAARREAQLAAVRQKCLDLGAADVLVVRTDVTVSEDLRVLHDAACAFFRRFPDEDEDGENDASSPPRVDQVTYCVGALTVCPFDATQNLRDEDAHDLVDSVFRVNATAPILAARVFMPTLRAAAQRQVDVHVARKQRSRSRSRKPDRPIAVHAYLLPAFTVVSSVAGLLPAPSRALYCASKAALHGFFDSLRMEERRAQPQAPVRVQLVAPGTIVGTDLRATALDRMLWHDGMPVGSKRAGLQPEDVAREMARQVDDVLILPSWYGAAVVLRALVPTWVDAMAMRKYK